MDGPKSQVILLQSLLFPSERDHRSGRPLYMREAAIPDLGVVKKSGKELDYTYMTEDIKNALASQHTVAPLSPSTTVQREASLKRLNEALDSGSRQTTPPGFSFGTFSKSAQVPAANTARKGSASPKRIPPALPHFPVTRSPLPKRSTPTLPFPASLLDTLLTVFEDGFVDAISPTKVDDSSQWRWDTFMEDVAKLTPKPVRRQSSEDAGSKAASLESRISSTDTDTTATTVEGGKEKE